MAAIHAVWHLVFPGFQSLDLAGPFEVFAGANAALDRAGSSAPRYEQRVVSLSGGNIASESGLAIGTEPIPAGGPGSLVIAGGLGVFAACGDAELVAATATAGKCAERLFTVCTGSFLAAEAGLLDGHRVATHWARSQRLRTTYPEIVVDADPLFVRSGSVWTSAGVTAGMDAALAIVEADHGAPIAQEVARWLVLHLRRPGGQSQFAAPVWFDPSPVDPVRSVQERVVADPTADLSVAALGRAVGVSPRHLTRLFRAELDLTPAKFVELVRVDVARSQLEGSGLTVGEVARRSGFASAETLRRAFQRRVGVSPEQYRRRFSLQAS